MQLRPLITAQEIERKVLAVAKQLSATYVDKELTLVIVLKGAFVFAADLIRKLAPPCRVEVVRAMSYGEKGAKRGDLTLSGIEKIDLEGRHLLLLDDIFDSGHTLEQIALRLQEKKPLSLKSLVLLLKKVERSTQYRPDYHLFEIENHFVVGYGLDYKELYRGLPGIWEVIET